MAANRVIQVLRERIARVERETIPDAALLKSFLVHRDEAAFAALVRRHAGMVWGVCLRTLRHHHDAEDAFQATFLVLSRKAASVQPPSMLAHWLFGVAHQTAIKARAMSTRRRIREKPMPEAMEAAINEPERWSDVAAILDHELSLLPDKYRAVIVNCDLAGKTRAETAEQLGIPQGTVAGRLARARAMLGKRLARRGITLSSAALTAAFARAATAAAPAKLLSTTLLAAAGTLSAPVAALVDGVIKTMLFAKIKSAAMSAVLMLALVGGGLGIVANAGPETAASKRQSAPPDAVQAALEKPAGARILEPRAALPPIADDAVGLQGTWQIVNDPVRKGEIWIIEGGRVRHGPDDKLLRSLTLRPTALPREIDIITQQDADGAIILVERGIYALDRDTLRLFLGRDGKRPAAFAAAPGDGEVLVLQRIDGREKPPRNPAPKKEPPARLRPKSFSETSGYEWRGVFAADDLKKRIFLCNPPNLAERIELTENWAKTVLKDWDKYRDQIVECYSRKDEAPLELYLLVDPKKREKPRQPDRAADATDDAVMKWLWGIPDVNKKYDGPTASFVIEGEKRTPLEQTELGKIKGDLTVEFTVGGYSIQPSLISPGPIFLEPAWEHPTSVKFHVTGSMILDRLAESKKLRGQRVQVTGKLGGYGYQMVIANSKQIAFLGMDQAWLAAEEELTLLQGKWQSLPGSTPAAPMHIVGNRLLSIMPEHYTVLRVDPSKQPKEIDFVPPSTGAPQVRKAIYKLEKGVLTICMAFAGRPRPTEFKAVSGESLLTSFQHIPGSVQPLLKELLK